MSSTKDWKQVKRLFLATLDAEVSQRQDFLARNATTPSLHRQVAELLDSHEKVGDFLLAPAAVKAEPAPNEPHIFAEDDLLAGRFRIVRFLASGGMGEVYEAFDCELRTKVAIKTIRAEIARSPKVLEQFRREVQLARQVTHPNVCRIYDFFRHSPASGAASTSGMNGEDIVFVSMELLHGEMLTDRLRRTGRIPEQEALLILRQLASALAAAHEAGVLHRDLKPGNIMLELLPDGEQRTVIMDFGLAWTPKRVEDSFAPGSERILFGTPDFMSPEQIEGKPVTLASDIYSFGLVAYQMLTGERPFASESPLYAALRRLKETPRPPGKLAEELSPRWNGLMARCLHPDPTRRFADVSDLLEALDAIGVEVGEPIRRSRSLHRGEQTRKWRWKSVAVTALLLVNVAAVLFPFWQSRVTGLPLWSVHLWRRLHRLPVSAQPITVVLADFVNTTGDADFDHSLNIALEAALRQSPYLVLMPRARIQQALTYMRANSDARMTGAISRQVCAREGGEVVIQGTIFRSVPGYGIELKATDCVSGKTTASLGEKVDHSGQILSALDQLSDRLRASLGESKTGRRRFNVAVQDATTSSLDALFAYSRGIELEHEQGEIAAEPYFRRALAIDPNFALAYLVLASQEWNRGDIVQAHADAKRAYQLSSRVTQWEQFYIRSSYDGIITGNIPAEMQTNEQWMRAYPRDDHAPLELAVDESLMGDYPQAERDLHLVLRNNPALAEAYGNLGVVYLSMERPDEAEAVLNQAEAAHLHEINVDWDRYWIAFYRRDDAQMQQIVKSVLAATPPDVTMLEQLARTAASQGRLRESHRIAVLAAREAMGPDRTESAALILARESLWEAEFGMKERAQNYLRPVLQSQASRSSKDVEIVLALIFATVGQPVRAEQLVSALRQQYPQDTLLHQYWIPVIEARIQVMAGRPARAVAALASSTRYELGIFNPLPCMYSVYLRGQAHLAMGQNVQAVQDFQYLLGHRGIVLNCPTATLSQGQLALAGDAAVGSTAYDDLSVLLRDADKNLVWIRKLKPGIRDGGNRARE